MDDITLERQREELLAYLENEKLLFQNDIEEARGMTDEVKVEKGLLVVHALFTASMGQHYAFSCQENNTKLRSGDSVYLVSEGNYRRYEAVVVENEMEGIVLSMENTYSLKGYYRIEVSQMILLDPLIQLTRRIEGGGPGAAFFKMLFCGKQPAVKGLGALPPERISLPNYMNERQQTAIRKVAQRPSLFTLQGPPGTGKTDVLATIAILFSRAGKEVLIVSNTHFAVNNALSKIHAKESLLPVIKIGEELKALELEEGIERYATFYNYNKSRKLKVRRRIDPAAIVGMTIQSATINLGLRTSGFSPMVVLVDEAGQMELSQGAVLGAFGAGSIILIGDDQQMPPVFHHQLVNHPLARSIFSYVKELFPSLSLRLTETYRMNKEITALVSKAFYEDSGEGLVSSNHSAGRRFSLPCATTQVGLDPLLQAFPSVVLCQVDSARPCRDDNEAEATKVASLVTQAINGGVPPTEMAVITPFRRQVKLIHSLLKVNPLANRVVVDTVERLQGKDVELIIISLCASSAEYINAMGEFILNKNRLNVMISRAKSKVILLFSENLRRALTQILGIE